MDKTSIGVIGAGQMGTQIGKVANEDHDVIFYDIDVMKSKRAAKVCQADYVEDIDLALRSHILFLAVPRKAVIEILQKHHSVVSEDMLWVNICTFVTLKDILGIVGKVKNVLSCKIIGHFEMMSPDNPCAFIIHDQSPQNDLTHIVDELFSKLGIVVYDNEEKYLEVNYIAASEGMKGVIRAANLLKRMDIRGEVIEAAVKHVFLGTARQFPFLEPDYFHDLVYQRNPGLRELNREILEGLKP